MSENSSPYQSSDEEQIFEMENQTPRSPLFSKRKISVLIISSVLVAVVGVVGYFNWIHESVQTYPVVHTVSNSDKVLCESTGGEYIGCPECPADAVCESCLSCKCPTGQRFSPQGCQDKNVVQIDPEHQICNNDEDCKIVPNHCLACSCDAVHEDYQGMYADQFNARCTVRRDVLCEPCLDSGARCIGGKCQYNEDALVIRVGYNGGLCPYGVCTSQWELSRDGSYFYITGSESTSSIEGGVSVNIVNDLEQLIAETDFDAIKNDLFTDICPTAYDGQEVTYQFFLDERVENISTCVYNLAGSSELIRAIDEIQTIILFGK